MTYAQQCVEVVNIFSSGELIHKIPEELYKELIANIDLPELDGYLFSMFSDKSAIFKYNNEVYITKNENECKNCISKLNNKYPELFQQVDTLVNSKYGE